VYKSPDRMLRMYCKQFLAPEAKLVNFSMGSKDKIDDISTFNAEKWVDSVGGAENTVDEQ